jgi:hypothetical protein
MGLRIQPKQVYAHAKLQQFENIAKSPEVKEKGLIPTLKRYGYEVTTASSITMCRKGMASIIYQGEFNLARVTIVVS